jgi:glyoxylase-like metal-dependent hydrolase (beta-lactamase superfamily II)
MIIFDHLVVGPLQVNCYILGCRRTSEAVVVDPGGDAQDILAVLQRHGLKLTKIVNTHAHFDHVLGVRDLQAIAPAPFLLHPAEAPVLETMQEMVEAWLGVDPGLPPTIDEPVQAGQIIHFGQESVEVRATPGHSPGGISLVDHDGRRVITGDALFAGSIGRTDLPGSDPDLLLRSIRQQILSLPEDYAVYPGHGPATTVAEEHRNNPFLRSGVDREWLR